MINDVYQLDALENNTVFQFNSIGKQGTITKLILFQFINGNTFNLAFGDFKNNKLDDKIISDNGDLIKVISTVALSIYLFFDAHPNAIIEIQGVDKKRQQLYNHIFRRRKVEIDLLFTVLGEIGGQKESLKNGRFYNKFVIKKKKN